MLYTLANDKIRAVFSDHGAELQSLVMIHDGTEYLWQRDEKYWNRCAILLFPICGRLKDKKYIYRGKTYSMDIHGFLKDSDLSISEKTDTAITFVLSENENTLSQYPFCFHLSVTYTLENTSLRQSVKVINSDSKELIFSLGGHPGFNVPMEKGECFEDYSIQFVNDCKPSRLCMNEKCLYLGKNDPYPLTEGVLPLRHDLFDNDAIFLTDVSDTVTLISGKSGRFVTIFYPGFRNIGLWHTVKVPAPFLCIEPWTSTPSLEDPIEDLETKFEMEHLAPGDYLTKEFTITIG